MKRVAGMRHDDGIDDAKKNFKGFLGVKGRTGIDEFLQRHALEQLHDRKRHPASRLDIGHVDDIGVIQTRHGSKRADKILAFCFPVR